MNFGFPLVDADAELGLPGAERGTAVALRRAPTDLRDEAEDELHEVIFPTHGDLIRRAQIVNASIRGGVAVALSWTAQSLPCLQVWRHLAPGMNVLALEPATNTAVPRGTLEAASAIRMLAAGETVEHNLWIDVRRGPKELAALPAPEGGT